MKRFILALIAAGPFMSLALLTFALVAPAFAAAQAAPKISENIVLSLPESALAQAMAAVTPFAFNSGSNILQGTITVRGVHNLRLDTDHVRARLDLVGSNLEVLTNLGGQQLRMRVGEATLAAEVLAELRFDGKRRILYIKPVVDQSRNAEGDEVGRGLIALLNGREFPVNMKDIEPFVAEIGGKTITIASRVADIRILPKKLELSLTPKITSQVGK